MYNNLELGIIAVCAVVGVVIYIYLKASGEMWYGINWKAVAKSIRKLWRRHK